jgi:hypothetical protein
MIQGILFPYSLTLPEHDMVKKLIYFVIVSLAINLGLHGGKVAAQQPVAAQEFVSALQDLILQTMEGSEAPQGRIVKAIIEIGVIYTKDNDGKLHILAVPHDASFTHATVHKLTLHRLPKSRHQEKAGEADTMGSVMPLPTFPSMSAPTPESREKIMEMWKKKVQDLYENAERVGPNEEKKAP